MRSVSSGSICALLLACATMILAGCAAKFEPASWAERPNIVLIFADDHAWQAISAYSPRLIETPNIDRLAKEGTLFRNCYVPNSICGPSRAAVLTGKYSHANGFYRNGNQFDGGQWTFPKALQVAGYETALIGKWHLGEHMAPQGFDYSCTLIGQGPYYNPAMLLDEDGDGKREEISITGYTTDVVTDLTLDWFENRKESGKPFLAMTQHKAPHRPWMPALRHLDEFEDETVPEPETLFDDYEGRPRATRLQDMTIAHTMVKRDLKLEEMPDLNEEQRAQWNAVYGPRNEAFLAANLEGDDLVRWKYQRYIKDYLRCIRAMDENVGRILDYLDETGLAENTIVIYSSDQGFFLGEHGWFDKRWMYEESMKTPLLVRWPGHTKPGSVSEDLVSVLDFAATFCDVAGTTVGEGGHGRSLVPVLDGRAPEDWRDVFYYHYYEYPGWHAVRKHYGVADGRYKLMYFYELDMREWHLVDLEADPQELRNFYDDPAYAEVQARLHEALDEARAELGVPELDPLESFPADDPFKPREREPARRKTLGVF